MLKVSLAVGDTVYIDRGIRITVVAIERRGRVQVSIGAPDHVAVSRGGKGFEYHLARQILREQQANKAGTGPAGDGA